MRLSDLAPLLDVTRGLKLVRAVGAALVLPPCNQPPKQPAPLMSSPARSDTRLHASNQYVASSGAIPVLERMITELTVQQPDDALGFMIDFLTTTREEPAASASRHERGAGSALEPRRNSRTREGRALKRKIRCRQNLVNNMTSCARCSTSVRGGSALQPLNHFVTRVARSRTALNISQRAARAQ